MRNELKKICTKCGEEKPLGAFSVYKTNGYTYRRNQCKPCRKSFMLENRSRYNKNRRDKYQTNDDARMKELIRTQKYRDSPDGKKTLAKSNRNAVEKLTDGYIRNKLTHKGMPKEKITPEIVTAQRALVKLKRAIKEKEMK